MRRISYLLRNLKTTLKNNLDFLTAFELFSVKFLVRICYTYSKVTWKNGGISLDKLDLILQKLERMEPLLAETHQIVKALEEAKDTHRALLDNHENQIAKIRGTLSAVKKAL